MAEHSDLPLPPHHLSHTHLPPLLPPINRLPLASSQSPQSQVRPGPSLHAYPQPPPPPPPPPPPASRTLLTSPPQSSPARSLPLQPNDPSFDRSPLPPLRFPRPLPHRRHHTCSQIEYGSHNPQSYSILPPITSSNYPESRPILPGTELPLPPPHPSQSDYPMSDDTRIGAKTESASDDASERAPSSGKKKKKSQRFYCRDFPPCQLSFTRSEHLARHIRKHTGEKPFRCHCGRYFSRLDNLRQHAQTVHVNQEIPPDSLASFVSRNRARGSVSGPRIRASTISGLPPSHSRNLSTSSIASNTSGVSTNFAPLESRMSALGIVEGNIGGIAGIRQPDKHSAHARAVSVTDLPSFQFPPRPPRPPAFTFPPPPLPPTSEPVSQMPGSHDRPAERHLERFPERRQDQAAPISHPPSFQFPPYSHSQRPSLELPLPQSDPRDSNPLPGIESLVRPVLERRIMYGSGTINSNPNGHPLGHGPVQGHAYSHSYGHGTHTHRYAQSTDGHFRPHLRSDTPESSRSRDNNPMLTVLME